jgi:hypothetical protein
MTKKRSVDFETFNELRERYEPLRPELRPYLQKARFGYFIRHPFCNESILDLDRCALIHQTIDERMSRADRCFEGHDYEGYLNCIEIYSQPEWLAKDADLLSDDRYWPIMRRVYHAQKYTHGYRDLFDRLFRADRPGRENLMKPEERETLAHLPDEVVVYRGYSDDDYEGYAEGISWTLDRRAAIWFANWNRDADYPRVITGKVRKEDIWAFFDGGDLLLPPEAGPDPVGGFVSGQHVADLWLAYLGSRKAEASEQLCR